jgi:glycosyltransferase involved in cell wall biosynthesis
MRPRSVLFVTPRWTRDGGVSAHVQRAAAVLAGADIDVHVVAGLIDEGGDAPGVHLHHSPRLFDTRAPAAERLGTQAFMETEIAHLHQVDDPDLVAALRAHAPVVISAHGFTGCTSGVYYFEPGHECVRHHGVGCVPNLMFRGCAHTDYPKTLPRRFVNVTRAVRALRSADFAISYGTAVDRHLAANRIAERAIVPYFPTMEPRPAGGHERRRRAVFAGRVVREKGAGVLLRAAVDVDGDFLLCGDGRHLDAMRELAVELGIAERVTFTGWLGPDDLAVALGEASVVVMPSLWPEPFGLVGIEGFAAGRPAVASATGGIVDWLDDGISGFGVPPGDAGALAHALQTLLDDPARQAEMGAAGRATVAGRFSPERHLEAVLAAYERASTVWSSSSRATAAVRPTSISRS